MKNHLKSPGRAAPRPFLKWVGGKRASLPALIEAVKKAGKFERYHEPFVGGGALFFDLARADRLGAKKAWLADNNAKLVETYEAVRDELDEVLTLLSAHAEAHSKEYYYRIRGLGGTLPPTRAQRAARIIYLNKTCFNGLYRENSSGGFNVPMGKYKNPKIRDERNLRVVSKALRKAKLDTQSFAAILDNAEPGDLVYFDPPYHPVSQTSSFTAYNLNGFDEPAQRMLAHVATELDKKGVMVLASNSMTPLVEDIYSRFHIRSVMVNRVINSKAANRGKIPEALISNFA